MDIQPKGEPQHHVVSRHFVRQLRGALPTMGRPRWLS